MENHRLTLKVTGKVQGVFFRASTLEQANILGLTGTVKNLQNGNVRIVAEGNKDSLNLLHEWCKIGPERAIVNSIDAKWETAENNFNTFEII